jgi:hypothetical protein
VLHLIIVAPKPGLRAYGIEMSCEIYVGFEEMVYSVADHAGKTAFYGGGVYVKEAENATLLKACAAADPVGRKPRYFSLVGSDDCYEVLGFSQPIIRAFDSPDEAHAWGLQGKAARRLSAHVFGRARLNHATWNHLVEATQSKNA